MDAIINHPASCEVRSVIWFLHAAGANAAEIHRRFCRVYGNIMSDIAVQDWCRKFKNGCEDVHNDGGQGWHSIVTDELVQHIEQRVHERCRSTIS